MTAGKKPQEFPHGARDFARSVNGKGRRRLAAPTARFHRLASMLDRRADRAEDAADRAAQEQEGNDRNDRDEGEDQRVLRETLAFLVTPEGIDERGEEGHSGQPPTTYAPRAAAALRQPRPPNR